MVWVVLKSGKAVRYNNASTWVYENGGTTVTIQGRGGKSNTFADFPVVNIERIEFQRPCIIRKDCGRKDRLPIAR